MHHRALTVDEGGNGESEDSVVTRKDNIVEPPLPAGAALARFLVTGGKKTVKKRTEFIDLTLEIVKESGYNTDL